MRDRHLNYLPLIAVISIFITTPLFGQESGRDNRSQWTGRLKDGTSITTLDLIRIIKSHAEWVRTEGLGGSPARLAGADISEAYIPGCDLRGADLTETVLKGASLQGAKFHGKKTKLVKVDMEGARLERANFSNSQLTECNFQSAGLSEADFSGAGIIGGTLRGAAGIETSFRNSVLFNVDLSESKLYFSSFRGAALFNVDVTGSYFFTIDFAGTIWEPKAESRPLAGPLVTSQNLDHMKFRDYPGPLIQLRAMFKEAGMPEQERAISVAILRQQTEIKWKSGTLVQETDALLRYVLFDLTCDYGIHPLRPVLYSLIIILVMSWYYFWVVADDGNEKRSDLWIRSESVPSVNGRTRIGLPLRCVLKSRVGGTVPSVPLMSAGAFAFYFSVLSTFRIGFRDFNVENWITRMQCSDYVLYATGWVRFWSGLQSFVCLVLLAMSILTYFGWTFD